MSDIEGKAARVAARERGQRASFNRYNGKRAASSYFDFILSANLSRRSLGRRRRDGLSVASFGLQSRAKSGL
jgi:hypothetical protein